VGILLPYGAIVPWLLDNGFNPSLLLQEAIVNPISVFAWLDVFVSAVALITFIVADGKRNSVSYRYIAVVGTLCVGVSFGLPFYLYLKEKQSIK
jgi:hypothetical protein